MTKGLAFNQILMNIFTNYVPNKCKFIDDQDLLQMNDCIKSNIQQKTFYLHNILRTEKLGMITKCFKLE